MPRWLRALTIVMMLLFSFAVVVQYNDPDPFRWIAMYGAAVVACVLALAGRMQRWLPIVIAVVAIGWAALLLPDVLGVVNPLDMFDEFEMKSEPIEIAREGFGLLIVAAWMIVLAALSRRAPTRSATI